MTYLPPDSIILYFQKLPQHIYLYMYDVRDKLFFLQKQQKKKTTTRYTTQNNQQQHLLSRCEFVLRARKICKKKTGEFVGFEKLEMRDDKNLLRTS